VQRTVIFVEKRAKSCLKVQRTVIFVAKTGKIKIESAAHRDIKFNITVRCTFKKKTLPLVTGILILNKLYYTFAGH
jgi:hypothetical protein